MKIIVLLISMIFSISAFGEDIKVNINGLHCGVCEGTLEKNLKSHSSTKAVQVDMIKLEVILSTHPSKTIADAELTKIITDSGFIVEKINRKVNNP